MAVTQTTEKSSNGFLYFVVGALVIAVGVLAYFYFNGTPSSSSQRADNAIERSVDKIGDAARDVGDAAKDAARNVTPAPTPAPAPTKPSAPTVPPG